MGDTHNQLTAVKCEVCDALYVPPKYLCPVDGANQFAEVPLSGQGEILTYTTIRVPSLGFEDQVPYDIAIIRLKEGINLTARIINQEGEKLNIGDKVSFVKKEGGAHWFRVVS
jgi:uncharacterized OB-fold protein